MIVAISKIFVLIISLSFKFKQKVTSATAAGGTDDVEIMVPLIYLSSF